MRILKPKDQHASYYNSLFSGILIICIALTIGFSILTSINSVDWFIKTNMETAQHLITIADKTIHPILEQANSQCAQLSLHKSYTRNLNENLDIDYNAANDLLSQLSNIIASNDQIHSIYAVYPHHNMVISSYGVYDYEMFHDVMWLTDSAEVYNPYWVGKHTILNDKLTKTTTDVISLVYKLPYFEKQNTGFLVYNIKTNYLSAILSEISSSNHTIAFVDENHQVISIGSQTSSTDHISQIEQYLSHTSLKNKDNRFCNIGGEKYLFTTLTNHSSYWKLVCFSSLNTLIRSIVSMLIFLVCIASIFFLFSWLYAKRVVNRVYSPIEKLLQGTQTQNLSLAAANQNTYLEFQKINQHIDQIYRNNSKLRASYQQLLPLMKDRIILGLLYGQIRYNAYSAGRLMDFLEMEPLDISLYTVVLVCIDHYAEFIENCQAEEQLAFILETEAAANDVSSKFFSFSHMMELPTRPIVLTLGSTEREISVFDRNVFEFCSEVANKLSEKITYSVSFYIGSPVETLNQLQTSYSKASEVRSYGVLYGDSQILLYSNVQQTMSQFLNPMSYQKTLISTAKTGDISAVLSLVDEICKDLSSCASSFTYVKRFFSVLTNVLILSVTELEMDDLKVKMNQWQKTLDEVFLLSDYEQVIKRLKTIYAEITDTFSQNNERKIKQAAEEILLYIDGNYHRDIVLSDAATALLYTPSTINSILKQATQKTFYDLLTEKRISTAMELLDSTNLLISQICEEVGYSNVQSFIRMFKRVTGITPGIYREKCLNKKTADL